MSSVSSTSINIQATTTEIQNAKKQCESAQGGSFEALFSMFKATQSSSSDASSSSSSSASGNVTQANGSSSSIFDVFLSENSAASDTSSSSSDFSSDFTNTFGNNGGPLFDWINKATSSLHLSSDQNAALQKIAIEHANTNGSTDDISAISAELTAAGIA